METNIASVLVIEEHHLMRESLNTTIEAESDLQVLQPAANLADAFSLAVSNRHDVFFLPAKPDIILFSLGNPGLDDLAALADLRNKLADTPIIVSMDGVRHSLKAGETVLLSPGESITLPTGLYHEFWGVDRRVLVGEVSKVNDDANDNCFLEPLGRFPEIEEDEPPLHLLVGDYGRYYSGQA